MTARSIILLSCSHDKRQGGAGYDTRSRHIHTDLPRTGRSLIETRLKVGQMLRGEPGSPRLFNDDVKGGFRDERACNKQLRLGPDVGGQEEGSYLPAFERYAGRFFSRLNEDAPEFWEKLHTCPIEVLFVSGLYALLMWDEIIQDYDCHFGDYTKGRRRNSVAGIWRGTLAESLCEFVRCCRERAGEVLVFDLLSELSYQELFEWRKVASSGTRIHHRILRNFAGPDILPKLATLMARELPRFSGQSEQFERDQWYGLRIEDTTVEFGFEYPIGSKPDAGREGDTSDTREPLLEAHPDLADLPPEILNQIVLAEHSWRIVEPSRQFDFGVIIVAFAKAVESYFRLVEPTWRGPTGKIPTLGMIVNCMQGTRWSPLSKSVDELNELRRGGAHSGKDYGSKDVQLARARAFDILARAEQIRSRKH